MDQKRDDPEFLASIDRMVHEEITCDTSYRNDVPDNDTCPSCYDVTVCMEVCMVVRISKQWRGLLSNHPVEAESQNHQNRSNRMSRAVTKLN